MITIEQSKVEDAKNIQEVFYKTWLATYPNEGAGITVADIEEKYKNRLSEEAIKKRESGILDTSGRSLLLTAKDEDIVVGVCKLKKKETCDDLEAIYILPSHQGKGIGQMFWDVAIKYFKNGKDIVVQVATYNTQAISFYKKLGFVDTKKRFTLEIFKMPISGSCIPLMEMIMRR